ncbi:hypothetical protein AB4Y96_09085 [Phyllobacterium sp. TAF24]
MSATICNATQDGTWIAVCLLTRTTASGTTYAEALAELRRLLSGRRMAA